MVNEWGIAWNNTEKSEARISAEYIKNTIKEAQNKASVQSDVIKAKSRIVKSFFSPSNVSHTNKKKHQKFRTSGEKKILWENIFLTHHRTHTHSQSNKHCEKDLGGKLFSIKLHFTTLC